MSQLDEIELLNKNEKLKKYLESLGICDLKDILYFYPLRYEDRKTLIPLSSINKEGEGFTINTKVEVLGISSMFRKKTLNILVKEGNLKAELFCFGKSFLGAVIKKGMILDLWGIFYMKKGRITSSNFRFNLEKLEKKDFCKIEPIYKLPKEFAQSEYYPVIKYVLNIFEGEIQEVIPKELIKKRRLLNHFDAIKKIHFPESKFDLDSARSTIEYEEFFGFFKEKIEEGKGLLESVSKKRKPLVKIKFNEALASIPYKLTQDQLKAIENIVKELEKPFVMSHLVQGEVGSGKTLVAFLISILVIENGGQVLFMSPTELLAFQHFKNAQNFFFENMSENVYLLTGSTSKREKDEICRLLASGDAKIVIGTHALIYQDFEFKNFSMAIIDEQQRFGVEQRKSLFSHEHLPDLIYLSATPIPQTLASFMFFNKSVSTIKTMPKNRAKITTHFAWQENVQKVYSFVKEELDKGGQSYFVYPLKKKVII